MISLSIIEKTDNSILYEILPGKPNPELPCEVDNDNRERVAQAAFKGNTCWYYTLNFIRKRIGKHPSPELSREREIERICSSRRKAQNMLERSLPDLGHQVFNETTREFLTTIDYMSARIILEKRSRVEHLFLDRKTSKPDERFFEHVQEFIKARTHSNMHEFLVEKLVSNRIKINLKFFLDLNIKFMDLYNSEISDQPRVEWQKLDRLNKMRFLDFSAMTVTAEVYGLKKSSWKPVSGIDALIFELNKNGPLFVSGKLGVPSYISEPCKTEHKVGDRDIYAWPDQTSLQRIPIGHSILLVGAKKVQDNTQVFFIDAADPSDPKDRSLQRIYTITYEHLKANTCDLQGHISPDSSVGYAYYG